MSTRLSPAERREQILAAARGLLRARTVEDLSVDAVAAAAGVSPGLVFHYFGSQREFRKAVIEAVANDLLAELRPSPEFSAGQQLRTGLDTFTAAVARMPALYLAIVRPGSSLSGLHSDFRSVLGEWLRAGLSRAGVTLTPALELALAGWLAFTEEALVHWLSDDQATLSRTEIVDLCERACRGALAAAAPSEWAGIEHAIDAAPARP